MVLYPQMAEQTQVAIPCLAPGLNARLQSAALLWIGAGDSRRKAERTFIRPVKKSTDALNLVQAQVFGKLPEVMD